MLPFLVMMPDLARAVAKLLANLCVVPSSEDMKSAMVDYLIVFTIDLKKDFVGRSRPIG